jgi:hypothetical protein
MAIVYQVLFSNGKRYIGITNYSLSNRRSCHYSRVKSGSKLAIHCALRKYTDVKWDILFSDLSYEEAKIKESELIKLFNTFAPNGYNLTIGGDGFIGLVYSDEHREKISKAHTGKKRSKEHIEAIKVGTTGLLHKDARIIIGKNIKTGEIIRYNSITLLEKEGIFDKVGVSKCAKGYRKSHAGYEWTYEESNKCRQN